MYVMSFVQQKIQNTVQDGIIYCRTSSIPDFYQLKASSASNQCDNQKKRNTLRVPE